jgi:two-component system chemotaxis sensor kinase CheA
MKQDSLIKYVVLPKEITATELKHVQSINAVAFWICAAHLPLFLLVSHLCGTSPVQAVLFWALLMCGPVLGKYFIENARNLSLIYGFTSMGLGALLVHLGQGPMQIEMHFHFFASLALLSVWGNPFVIWVAAVTVALHHGLFWFFLPQSVFNYNASFWVVLVHAIFVVVEAIAASFIARNFFDNVIGLEKIVQEKTQTIRNILDHVTYGLFICDENLNIKQGYSLSCLNFFNINRPQITEKKLTELLQLNERDSENMANLYAQVFEDLAPEDLTLGQLPSRFHLGQKTLALSGSVVRNAQNKVDSVLFCIMDITALVQAENQVAEAKSIFKILQEKESFQYFMNDLIEKMDTIKNTLPKGTEDTKIRQDLHTIKGNFSIYGLTEFVSQVHSLEEKQNLSVEEFNYFEKALKTFLSKNYNIIGISPEKVNDIQLMVTEKSVQEFEHQSLSASDIAALKDLTKTFCSRLRMKTIKKLLGPIDEMCLQISRRFGKKVKLTLIGGNLQVPDHLSQVLENVVHLIRNAIYHGVETTRERKNKPKEASLVIHFSIENDCLKMVLSDDGRGIDTHNLVKKAIQLGILDQTQAEKMTHEEKLNLIFVPNFSTAEEINDVSGRGLGMSAVMSSVKKSQGEIHVSTELGKGTQIVIHVPLEEARSVQSAA